MGGIDPARVLNPLHPVASGGFVGGQAGTITEDFTALTAGATYRADRWSVTGRAEYRAGGQGDRYGITAAALRQLGEIARRGSSEDNVQGTPTFIVNGNKLDESDWGSVEARLRGAIGG